MIQVISLPDGSSQTILSEKDAFDLVEKYIGPEMVDYLKELIEDATLLVREEEEAAYEELEEKYSTLQDKYDELKARYEERSDW